MSETQKLHALPYKRIRMEEQNLQPQKQVAKLDRPNLDSTSHQNLRKMLRIKLNYVTSVKWQISDEYEEVKALSVPELKFKSPLQLIEEANKKQDQIMQFDQPPELNKDIFENHVKKFGRPRIISADLQSIAIGGTLGTILIYAGDQKYVIEGGKGNICALDTYEGATVVGFENGTVALIIKDTVISYVQEAHQKCRVLMVKIISVIKNKVVAFSSDELGISRIIHFEKSLFSWDYEIQLGLKQQTYPFVSAQVLHNTDQHILAPNFKFMALSSLEVVLIVKIYFHIDKPIEIIQSDIMEVDEKSLYCSVSWGQGILPSPSKESQYFWNEPRLILLLSFKNVIYPYALRKDEPSYQEAPFLLLNPIVFPENSHIQHTTFFESSVFGVFCQKDKQFYLINTKNLHLHIEAITIDAIQTLSYKDKWGLALTNLYQIKIRLNEHKDHPISAKKLATKSQILNRPPLFNERVTDRSSTIMDRQGFEAADLGRKSLVEQFKVDLHPFHQSYSSDGNICYLLAERSVHRIILNDWKTSVDNMIKRGDWSNAMFLLKNVKEGSLEFSTKTESFDAINRAATKITSQYLDRLLKEIKKVFDKYKTLELKSNLSRDEQINQKRALETLNSMISLLIDFLLTVNTDLLFGQVYAVLYGFLKGNISILANELKNYILNGRVKRLILPTIEFDAATFKENRPPDVLTSLIIIYNRQNDQKTILQLVKSLDFKSIDQEVLMKICLDNQILKPLCYICIKGKDKLTPLLKLWGIFTQASSQQKFEEAFNSCLNLLEYLELIIELPEFQEILPSISSWLFEASTLESLFQVDLFGTMEVIIQLTTIQRKAQDKILFVLECVGSLQSFAEKPLVKIQQQRRSIAQPWNVILQSVSVVYEGLFFLSEMIGSFRLQSLVYLLQQPEALNLLPLSKFEFPHLKQCIEITYEILEFCKFYAQNQFLINLIEGQDDLKYDWQKIEEYVQLAKLYYVQICIAEKQSLHIKTLNLKVSLYRKFQHIPMEEHTEIFGWIDKVLTKNQQLKDFKDRVLFYLDVLVEINPEKTRKLIQKHFKDSDLTIISKLSAYPKLQLEYIDSILINEKDTHIQAQLLPMKVGLLCQLHPEEVVPFLKHQTISLDESLDICQKYDHNEAIAYLHERQGASVKAVQALVRVLQQLKNDQPKMQKAVMELTALCLRLSKFDDVDEVWITFVDALLELPGDAFIEQQLESVFSVWSQHSQGMFLKQIVTKYSHLRAANLCKTILGMYESQVFLENMLKSSQDMFHEIIFYDNIQYHKDVRKGTIIWGFCFMCRRRLQQVEDQIIQYFCGHTFHRSCINEQQNCAECFKSTINFYTEIFRAAKNKRKELKETNMLIQQDKQFIQTPQAAQVPQRQPQQQQQVQDQKGVLRSRLLSQFDQLRNFKQEDREVFHRKLKL